VKIDEDANKKRLKRMTIREAIKVERYGKTYRGENYG
jgi:hypothetical protein